MRAANRRRSRAAIAGEQLARQVAAQLGLEIRASRRRRQLTQQALADRIGISRQRVSQLEAGRGVGLPINDWFAIAKALDRYLRFEFARDPHAELADAGHLDIQELVLRLSRLGGWERLFEARSRAYGSDLSVDVKLIDRNARRLVISECWNTFGDLGAASRSSDRKLRDAEEQAVALAGDGEPFQVGLLWTVRDTKANRALVQRYPQIFEARFPGSSLQWLRALTQATDRLPTQPGLVWCDVRSTKLFARRRNR